MANLRLNLGETASAVKVSANRIMLAKSGDLQLLVNDGTVTLLKPGIYQLASNGTRREVKGEYLIKGNEIGFKVRTFDSRKPLIIDPVLSYSSNYFNEFPHR